MLSNQLLTITQVVPEQDDACKPSTWPRSRRHKQMAGGESVRVRVGDGSS